MEKHINFNIFPQGNDSYPNFEQDLSIECYDPSIFSSKNLAEFNESIDDIDKRLYYQQQKETTQNLPKEEPNKNKNDLFLVNISGKNNINKNEEKNNFKKTEETAANSEKTELKLNQQKKNEIKTEVNENNNDSKEKNKNQTLIKLIQETKTLKLNNEKNNNVNINKNRKVSRKNFSNKKSKKKIETNGKNSNLKKVRLMLLNSIIRFVNKKIKKVFNNNIGKGIITKQFVNISKDKLTHSSVEYDKNYLDKKLREILSDSISGKYTNYLKNKNEELLQELINLEDKGDYFRSLFELTFLDCIEHINGNKNISLLVDFENVDEIILNENDDIDIDDIKNYKETIKHYKEYINNKNSRKSRKNN